MEVSAGELLSTITRVRTKAADEMKDLMRPYRRSAVRRGALVKKAITVQPAAGTSQKL